MLILPIFDPNNQPVPHTTGGSNNCRLSLNEPWRLLISGQVCAKALILIAPMVVRELECGGNSDLKDHKNPVNEYPLTSIY